MSRTLISAEHDWDMLREKYVHNNILDDKHGYFFTVGFYLEQIVKLKEFKGVFIGNKIKWRRDSPLKKQQIYWQKYVFEAWAKSYPETIFALPDTYTDKVNTIRKSDNITPGRFSKLMLIHYRLEGLYDYSKYKNYKKYFTYITEESKWTCLKIAITPLAILKRKFPYLISIEDGWEEKLNMIAKKIFGKNIIIYGAGLYGEKVIRKLIDDGFEDKILGVAVTARDNNVEEICGKKVRVIDEYLIHKKSAAVIVCALPAAALEMKKEVKRRRFKYFETLFGV